MAVANEVWMLENSMYSILSPEGFASILWKDGKRASEAAEIMKCTAADLKELGIIEKIIYEEEPVSVVNIESVAAQMKKGIIEFLKAYQGKDGAEISAERYERFRNM